MTTWLRFLSLAVAALTLAASGCDQGDDDSGPPGQDDDDHGDDDDSTPADSEANCDDGADNDGDGLVDCDDPDCGEVFHCTWPEFVDHGSAFVFDSSSTWVDDCETRFTSSMQLASQIDPCPMCDLTYEGPFVYSVNSCDEILDLLGVDVPDFGAYGMVFMSESQREIFSRDEDLQWYSAGVASWDPAPEMYVLQRVEDAGGFGTLTITLTFDDR